MLYVRVRGELLSQAHNSSFLPAALSAAPRRVMSLVDPLLAKGAPSSHQLPPTNPGKSALSPTPFLLLIVSASAPAMSTSAASTSPATELKSSAGERA